MARPTDYRPEYAQELLDYISEPPYEEILRSDGSIKREATDFKTLAGFAVKIGIDRGTLLDWVERHEEFRHAYKRIKDYQENYLAVNGNKGLINTAFGIFTAKNAINWADKIETKNETKEGFTIEFTEKESSTSKPSV